MGDFTRVRQTIERHRPRAATGSSPSTPPPASSTRASTPTSAASRTRSTPTARTSTSAAPSAPSGGNDGDQAGGEARLPAEPCRPASRAVPNSRVNEVVVRGGGSSSAALHERQVGRSTARGRPRRARHRSPAPSCPTWPCRSQGTYNRPAPRRHEHHADRRRRPRRQPSSSPSATSPPSVVSRASRSPWSTLGGATAHGRRRGRPTGSTRARNSCAGVFDTFMRDIDFSPDGTYFAVTTTGAFAGGAGSGTLCDTTTRWETATGTGQRADLGRLHRRRHDVRRRDHRRRRLRRRPLALAEQPLPGRPGRARRRAARGHRRPRPGQRAAAVAGTRAGRGASAPRRCTPPRQGLWVGSDTDLIAGERRQPDRVPPARRWHHDYPTSPARAAGRPVPAERTSAANSVSCIASTPAGQRSSAGDGGPDWSGTTFVSGGNTPTGDRRHARRHGPGRHAGRALRRRALGRHGLELPGARPGAASRCGSTSPTSTTARSRPVSGCSTSASTGTSVPRRLRHRCRRGTTPGTMRPFPVTSDGNDRHRLRATSPRTRWSTASRSSTTSVGGGATAGGLCCAGRSSGTGAPTGPTTTADTAIDWSTVRGAFLLNGTLYYGLADGNLYKRTFDQTRAPLGAATHVNLYDDPDDGARIPFAIANLTGMAYDADTHRIYYTVFGTACCTTATSRPRARSSGAQTFIATRAVSATPPRQGSPSRAAGSCTGRHGRRAALGPVLRRADRQGTRRS